MNWLGNLEQRAAMILQMQAGCRRSAGARKKITSMAEA